ncbi:cobalt transporter CbiM [Clostridium sp. DJ247]|uniref:cobalt transporter CbiM n=1 Tax=Clostridium sp. DJ247 TaxID=2726188 RepID=UPI001628ED92|nr:cobalt transporter CbiM [Clostridium sp. DJ247]MBC2582917.1 cobalt transporter CbiM [Clostridium sp. DJ247]
MHIPDNYLSPSTCVALGAVMLPVWRRAVTRVQEGISKKRLPLLGICSAFSFLVMMFNVPIPGGSSGHAVGATLIAILLGPDAAVISITVATVIQALFFGDGGILALGANTFNMAFIMPFSGYYTYKLIKGTSESEKRNYLAAFIGSYVGINIAALFTAIEFGIQPILFKTVSGLPIYCPYPLKVTIPSMLIPHLFIVGMLEGAITAGVYMYIKKLSPEMIYHRELFEKRKLKIKPIYGLVMMMIVLCPLGLLASGNAWGEWSTEELRSLIGYVPQGMENGFKYSALLADYGLKGLSDAIGYLFSAIVGVTIIFAITKLINKAMIVVRNR